MLTKIRDLITIWQIGLRESSLVCMAVNSSPNIAFYGKFLLFIAGMGGLLFGIDAGIIAAALLDLEKTVTLTIEQMSFMLAAVLGGSMFSSLVACILAHSFGRKTLMIVSSEPEKNLPCSLLGGVAQFIELWLGDSLGSRLVPCEPDVVGGALLMIRKKPGISL